MALPLKAQGRGQAMVFFALAAPLVLLPVAALAVDGASLATRQAHLAEATDLAALDAAGALDVPGLRAGDNVALDPAWAASVVQSELAASDPAATVDSVTLSGGVLTVSAHEDVRLFMFTWIAGRSATVRATAGARLTPGY